MSNSHKLEATAQSRPELSIVFAYYENPQMLRLQWEEISQYPDDLKARMEVLVVDDGSPVHPAGDVGRPDGLPRSSVFRLREDLPWNQDAARNIGAHEARAPVLLLTDIDHIIPEATLRGVLNTKVRDGVFYSLGRIKYVGGAPSEPHPNSYVLTKQTYWDIGGHDEDFAGIYGKDFLFRKRAFRRASEHKLPDLVLARVGSKHFPDASTRTLRRDNSLSKRVWGYLLEWLKAARLWRGIQTLTHPYDRVL